VPSNYFSLPDIGEDRCLVVSSFVIAVITLSRADRLSYANENRKGYTLLPKAVDNAKLSRATRPDI